MCRFLSLVFVFSICLLMMYSSSDSLVCAMQEVCSFDVICDDYNSQIVKIENVDCVDVVEGLNVEVVRFFYSGESLIIEGYTSLFNDYKIINNRKVNIQISVNDNVCLVGYPLIKSSF